MPSTENIVVAIATFSRTALVVPEFVVIVPVGAEFGTSVPDSARLARQNNAEVRF